MLTRVKPNTTDVFVGGPVRADLEKICEVLNSAKYPQRRDELRQLVQRWRESGPNLERMLESDEILDSELKSVWYGKYLPGKHGRAHISLLTTKMMQNDHEYAVGMFAALTLNPDCEKLGGPCAHITCGKYFVRKGKRLTGYCSRLCCQRASALRHTKRRLEEERKDKLDRARAAIQKWRTARTRDDWKTSVCKREPDITMRFLTRAVTRCDLVEPRARAA
jgi:hypothetical protein